MFSRRFSVLSLVLSALLGWSFLLVGCSGSTYVGDRSAFTARPLDALPRVGPVDVEALLAEHPEADAVMLRDERAMEHVFHLPEGGEWDFVDDRMHQYVVLDVEEERWSTIRIRVEKRGRLEGFFGRVTSPGGTVQTFTEADLIEERDDEDRVYSFAYPGIERGSVVEESFRLRHRHAHDYFPPLSHEVSLQYDVPVDSLKFRYVAPETWALQVKKIGSNRMPPFYVDRTSEDGKTIVIYEGSNIPAIPNESYAPFFKEVANYLEFQVTQIYANGDLVYETSTEWAGMAERFTAYAFRSGALFSDPAARAADEVVSGSEPDLEKLRRIVDWVQNTITLDEEAREESFASVLRNGRGNSLHITGLTQTMLDRAGIEAQFLLIHPASEGYFDREYIHGGQLYVPAVRAEIEGVEYVVFPYLRGLPIDFIPEAYQGQTAMQVTPDGFGGFVQVPRRPASEHAIDENYIVTLDEDGLLSVEEEKVLRGAAAYFVRRTLEDLSAEEREEEMRDLLTYTEGDIGDLAYTIENETAYEEPLVIRLAYTIDNLVTVTPEEILFQTSGLLSPATSSRFKVNVQERFNPIRIYNDEVKNKRITIRYPGHWTLTTALEDVEDRNRFGEVQGRYTVAPGELVAEQQVRLQAGSAPPRSYGSLLRLTGSESRLYVPTLIFEVGGGTR